MRDHPDDASPLTLARSGGALYLAIIVAGIFGELVVRGSLVVASDPVATAHNIAGSPLLWRLGIASDLLMHVLDVPLMLIMFVLLRPVNRDLASLAILFNLVQTTVLVANKSTLLMPLFLLGDAGYLSAMQPDDLQVLAYLSSRLHGHGLGVGLLFFGCACLIYGHLIARSGYLPRVLGVGMQIAGVAYLTNSVALLVAPAFAAAISPGILAPAFVAELSLCLWLLIKGVDAQRWRARSSAA